MSIWNQVLVWLIAVASLPYFYFATRTLKVYQAWGQSLVSHQQSLRSAKEENTVLREGSPSDPAQWGIRQMRLDLHKLLIERGRVWRGCTAELAKAQGNQIRISIPPQSPMSDPAAADAAAGAAAPAGGAPPAAAAPAAAVVTHGIANKTELQIFEDAPADKGGHYLGEFKVTEVDEANHRIVVQPMHALTQREEDRVRQSKAPWVLYEIMPVDDRAAFAGTSLDELKALLPEASLAEYARDGQPAQAGDAPERKVVVDGKEVYARKLRDYRVLLGFLHAQRQDMEDELKSLQRDKEYTDSALASAKEQQKFYQAQLELLKGEREQFRREQELVAKHEGALKSQLDQVRKLIAEKLAATRSLAGELAKVQREAARKIDQRTHAMAQARPVGTVN